MKRSVNAGVLVSRAFSSSNLVRELERFWFEDARGWTGEDEIDVRGLEPVAVFVEVGVDAGGADDCVRGFEGNVLIFRASTTSRRHSSNRDSRFTGKRSSR
jgi:hypothetical protein